MTTISVIVPTYNEAANIAAIHAGLAKTLGDQAWELIVVDDHSPDGTANEVRRLGERHANVRCIERIQDRGLCSAVQWGVQAAHGEVIVVMDGDLQHDASLIPAMCRELAAGHDIVSASRFLAGQDVKGLPRQRQRLSAWGNKLVDLFLGRQLTDPLTGFFATSRALFLRSIPKMQAEGFKILFDLLYHNRRATIKEVPLDFQPRQQGESKLQFFVFWLLACDIASKLTWGLIPPQLVSFVTVGLIGSTVHFSTLYVTFTLGAAFWLAQALATVCAMVFNFTINNLLTYSTYRLRGSPSPRACCSTPPLPRSGSWPTSAPPSSPTATSRATSSSPPPWASSSTSSGASSCRAA